MAYQYNLSNAQESAPVFPIPRPIFYKLIQLDSKGARIFQASEQYSVVHILHGAIKNQNFMTAEVVGSLWMTRYFSRARIARPLLFIPVVRAFSAFYDWWESSPLEVKTALFYSLSFLFFFRDVRGFRGAEKHEQPGSPPKPRHTGKSASNQRGTQRSNPVMSAAVLPRSPRSAAGGQQTLVALARSRGWKHFVLPAHVFLLYT